jgi:glycosyltransferase 2 family protein
MPKSEQTHQQRLRAIFRWGMVLATLAFLGRALYKNWQGFTSLDIASQAWTYAGAALIVGILSQVWLALTWGWILKSLQHPVPWRWGLKVFLTTEVAKFLPGNVWHMYGRARATQKAGIPIEVGAWSVLLEPILITAAAMGFTALHGFQPALRALCFFALFCILVGVHPAVFDGMLHWFGQFKKNSFVQWLVHRVVRDRKPRDRSASVRLRKYPLRVVLADFFYVGLRCSCFLLIVMIFRPITQQNVLPLMSGFSFAWILGLIMPGAPDGIGIFETVAILLFKGILPENQVLGAVIVYRLISTLSVVFGAGLGYLIGLSPLLTEYSSSKKPQ